MASKMILNVTIEESDDLLGGWYLSSAPDGFKEHHKSAGAALNAVRQRDAVFAQTSMVVVSVISWFPKSEIGFAVVKTLMSTD